jgi:hypothetical protein
MNEQIPEGKTKCPECHGAGVIMQVYDVVPAMNAPECPPHPVCPKCHGERVIDAPGHE